MPVSDKKFILESLQHVRTIKYMAATQAWCERYRDFSAKASFMSFKSSMLNIFINVLADLLIMLTAVAVMVMGTIEILANTMSVGALIAIMMIVWRILSPVKLLFSSQTRLNQLRSSIQQVNALMSIPTEYNATINYNKMSPLKGSIRFNHVSVRYPNANDFALMNVSFSVNPHEVVAIIGRNGSGKSTLFKLLLGLYKPQSGSIYIDNHDIRQLTLLTLRTQIGYVPEKLYLFCGSIAQNLYLVKPTATEEELKKAIKLAGLEEDIQLLPNGLETQLDDQSHIRLPTSFLQRLSLACTYLKNPSVILLDEPASVLDSKGEKSLLDAIEYFRGKATIFLISHQPRYFKLADKILLFHEGQLLLAGNAEKLIARIPKEFCNEELT